MRAECVSCVCECLRAPPTGFLPGLPGSLARGDVGERADNAGDGFGLEEDGGI